jgi:hypothetical protein
MKYSPQISRGADNPALGADNPPQISAPSKELHAQVLSRFFEQLDTKISGLEENINMEIATTFASGLCFL